VHYTVNGGPQANVRLTKQGSNYVQPVALNAGDVLKYSVTYSTGSAVFDTATLQYVAGSGGIAHYVVDLGADSMNGVCVANGDSGGQCNLRAALAAAQTVGGPAKIDLAVDSTVNAGQITLGPSSSIVVESMPGAPAHAIVGNATARLFALSAGADLTLRLVSIANFRTVDSAGAILNNGTLSLDGVTLINNTTSCFGVGAMTAFATCLGGAITNAGTLTIGGGSVFQNNTVSATASTASFTNAWAAGGAIVNSGTMSVVGHVFFNGNSANAVATSGFHNAPIGGASATASGGAIYNTGTLTFEDVVLGKDFSPPYIFLQNAAKATGSTVNGSATLNSAGGAIENLGTLQLPAAAAVFGGNNAQTGPNIDG
jgi:hypothetical protein